jgi:hypothetical protein
MMAKKSKEQQDDQSVAPPDDRLEQIEKEESRDKARKKSRRKPSSSRKSKQSQPSNETPEKAPDTDQQQSDKYIDLPEDRLDQIYKEESQEKTEKKTPDKRSTSGKGKQERAEEDTLAKVIDDAKPSKDDLLDDIRKSLASEEDIPEQKGLFGRFKDRLKIFSREKTEEVETPEQLEVAIEAPEELQEPTVVEPKPKKKRRSSTKQEEKAVQEFFSDLEALADVVPDEIIPEETEVPEAQPEEITPVEEKKPPKLPVRSEAKEEVDFEKVREVALQEYDETRVEPVDERKVSLQEEVRETIRESKPFERVLLVGVFVLTVGILLSAGIFIIVKSIPNPTPDPTIAADWEDRVHPTHLNLPGGWGFNLDQGYVIDGEWSPQGAEWLIGTEISRWVALPWSLQLEAVIRTLKSDDQIELTMSNNDSLVYNVYSIQEMTMEEIQALDIKTPSLIVILFDQEDDTGTYWVVTALP